MDLIMLVLVLSLIGCIIWVITTKVPMDSTLRAVIQWAAVILILLYLLQRFGVLPNVLP